MVLHSAKSTNHACPGLAGWLAGWLRSLDKWQGTSGTNGNTLSHAHTYLHACNCNWVTLEVVASISLPPSPGARARSRTTAHTKQTYARVAKGLANSRGLFGMPYTTHKRRVRQTRSSHLGQRPAVVAVANSSQFNKHAHSEGEGGERASERTNCA